MPPKFLLEIAVASFERAVAAERAGADRLDLCVDLEAGGLTPSIQLIRQVRSAVNIPIHALVRPRPGDFIYTPDEFALMKEEITAIVGENVQGIVTGVLLPDGSVDKKRTRELIALAAPMQATYHRAFDKSRDRGAALEDIILIGAYRILAAGGIAGAAEGAAALRSLIQKAGNRITFLPGGGLHAGNIAEVARVTGAHEFHTGLGGVLPYASQNIAAFESAVRDCLAELRR